MSTDPLRLSDILAALPDEADYDAIYAELAATPRGRWFLREHAGRNHQADMHMLVGALARVEAAVRGDPLPQIPASLAAEFSDLAAAIGRIEAEIAASGMPTGDGLPAAAAAAAAAAERIQDVAFALREREIDAALCDVLEAAIGEVGDAFARNDAAAERTRNAAALLREVSARINALIALAVAGAGGGGEPFAVEDAAVAPPTAAQPDAIEDEAAGEDAAIAETPLAERSAAEAREDEYFAAAIGALAASFSPPEDAGEPVREPASGEPVAAMPGAADANVSAASEQPEPAASASIEAAAGEAMSVAALASGAAETEWTVPADVERERAMEEDVAAEHLAAEHVAAEHVASEHLASEQVAAEEHVADNPSPVVAAQDAIEEAVGAVATPVIDDIRASAAGETQVKADAGGVIAPANEVLTSEVLISEVILIATPASEMPPSEELPPSEEFSGQDLASEESAREEPAREEPASEELPGEQSPSAAASPEDSSSEEAPGQGTFAGQEMTARTNEAPQHHAEHADIAADHPVGNKPGRDHDAVRLYDSAQEPVIAAAPAPAAARDGVGSLREAWPAHPLLPDSQAPSGPQEDPEDPGDLFEPLPLPIPSPLSTLPAEEAAAGPTDIAANPEAGRPTTHDGNADDAYRILADVDVVTVSALSRARSEQRADEAQTPASAAAAAAAKQIFPAEPPASTPAGLPLPQPLPPPRAAATPVARAAPRPAASDPLASVRALSEEELIALFS